MGANTKLINLFGGFHVQNRFGNGDSGRQDTIAGHNANSLEQAMDTAKYVALALSRVPEPS